MTTFSKHILSNGDAVAQQEKINIVNGVVTGRKTVELPPSLKNAEKTVPWLERQIRVKSFLGAVVTIRENHSEWIEFTNDPTTCNCDELKFLQNSPKLAFTLWMAERTGVINLDPSQPFLSKLDIQSAKNKRQVSCGTLMGGRVDRQDGLKWEQFGCPNIEGVDTDALHSYFERLREIDEQAATGVYEPLCTDGASVPRGDMNTSSLMTKCLRQYSFPIKVYRRPFWDNECFHDTICLVLAMEGNDDDSSVLHLVRKLIPELEISMVKNYRQFSLTTPEITHRIANRLSGDKADCGHIAEILRQHIVAIGRNTPIAHRACNKVVADNRSEFEFDWRFGYVINYPHLDNSVTNDNHHELLLNDCTFSVSGSINTAGSNVLHEQQVGTRDGITSHQDADDGTDMCLDETPHETTSINRESPSKMLRTASRTAPKRPRDSTNSIGSIILIDEQQVGTQDGTTDHKDADDGTDMCLDKTPHETASINRESPSKMLRTASKRPRNSTNTIGSIVLNDEQIGTRDGITDHQDADDGTDMCLDETPHETASIPNAYESDSESDKIDSISGLPDNAYVHEHTPETTRQNTNRVTEDRLDHMETAMNHMETTMHRVETAMHDIKTIVHRIEKADKYLVVKLVCAVIFYIVV